MEQNLWLAAIIFHFGTENCEEQLQKPPCIYFQKFDKQTWPSHHFNPKVVWEF